MRTLLSIAALYAALATAAHADQRADFEAARARYNAQHVLKGAELDKAADDFHKQMAAIRARLDHPKGK